MTTRFPLYPDRRDIMVLGLGTVHKKAYTGTAGVTDNAIQSQIVRVVCTTAAHIVFGDAPTATTSHTPVAANTPEYFMVPTPGTSKLSAVMQASGGDLYVTECL